MRLHSRFLPLFCAAQLALCQLLILLPLIGLAPIGGSSEAREAHISNLVLQHGEWLLPLRDGLLPSKPPLFHWITALLGTLGGEVTPFVARLTSLFFASAVIFVTALMALAVCEFGSSTLRRDKQMVALATAGILATTFGFQNMSGDARVDMTYCFFVCLSLFPILTAGSSSGRGALSSAKLKQSWRWNLFFVAMGLGVLAKGPIAIVLPCLIVFFVLWSTFGLPETARQVFRPRPAWLFFLLIAVPWYILAWKVGGEGFVNRQLWFENLQRFSGGENVNSQEVWYYVPAFLRTALPWSLLFCAALPEIISFFRQPATAHSSQGAERSLRQPFATWFLVGFVFLSIASGKRQSYLLPLFPGMAIFLALRGHQYLTELSDRGRARLAYGARACWVSLVMLLLLLAGCFDVLRFPFSARATLSDEVRMYLREGALQIEVLLVLLAILLIVALRSRRDSLYARMLPVYAALLGLCAVLIYSGLGVKNFLKGFDRAAPQIAHALAAGEKLSVVRQPREEFFDPLLYYLSREVTLVPQQEAASICPSLLLMRNEDLAALKSSFKNLQELQLFNSLDREYEGKLDQQYVLLRCG